MLHNSFSEYNSVYEIVWKNTVNAVNLWLQNTLRIFNIYYLLTATIITQTPEFYVIRTLMFSA